MRYLQLFRELPCDEFIEVFLSCYGFNGLDDLREITCDDIINLKTIQKLNELIPEMVIYYLPCKAEIYLKSMTWRKSITVLGQFLKLVGFSLCRKEKLLLKKKKTFYSIQRSQSKMIKFSTDELEISFC